jgi:hypothetical protein
MDIRSDLVTLPHSIIVGAIQYAVSRSFKRVLESSPSERIGYMQLALPVLQAAEENKTIFSVECPIEKELEAQFAKYCADMRLNPLPLLVGAMMVELQLGALPSVLPDFSHVCGTDS